MHQLNPSFIKLTTIFTAEYSKTWQYTNTLAAHSLLQYHKASCMLASIGSCWLHSTNSLILLLGRFPAVEKARCQSLDHITSFIIIACTQEPCISSQQFMQQRKSQSHQFTASRLIINQNTTNQVETAIIFLFLSNNNGFFNLLLAGEFKPCCIVWHPGKNILTHPRQAPQL